MPDTKAVQLISPEELAVLSQRSGWLVPRWDVVRQEFDHYWWDVYPGTLQAGPQRSEGLSIFYEHLSYLGLPSVDWMTLGAIWALHCQETRETPSTAIHLSEFAEYVTTLSMEGAGDERTD